MGMDYQEERLFRNNRDQCDDMWYDDDFYPDGYREKNGRRHDCGCENHDRRRGCGCHSSHHHYDDGKRCGEWKSCDRCGRWGHCDCHRHPGHKGVHRVCRELSKILKEQKHPNKPDCGCHASIRQLTGHRRNLIIPFMLTTRNGRLFVEWGRERHRTYATVFFSVVRVNCRYNEAVLELLKPEPPITNRRTGRIDKRRIRNVEYLVPTGERVFVDLTPMRDVKRLPKDLVKR